MALHRFRLGLLMLEIRGLFVSRVNLPVGQFRREQQNMRQDSDAEGYFVKVINAWIDFLALERTDVGSLEATFQAQILLGPTKQRPDSAQIGCEADAGCGLTVWSAHF